MIPGGERSPKCRLHKRRKAGFGERGGGDENRGNDYRRRGVDGDGDTDIVMGNDCQPNHVFFNPLRGPKANHAARMPLLIRRRITPTPRSLAPTPSACSHLLAKEPSHRPRRILEPTASEPLHRPATGTSHQPGAQPARTDQRQEPRTDPAKLSSHPDGGFESLPDLEFLHVPVVFVERLREHV